MLTAQLDKPGCMLTSQTKIQDQNEALKNIISYSKKRRLEVEADPQYSVLAQPSKT